MTATENKLGLAAWHTLASGSLGYATTFRGALDQLEARLTKTATQSATQSLAIAPQWRGQIILRESDNQVFFGAATGTATDASWRKVLYATSILSVLPPVTATEAQVGTATANRAWSPARVKTAIEALDPGTLPRSYLAGCQMANGTDADHDINFTAGVARDNTNAADITPVALVKQIDATWVAGTAAGGLASGATLSNNTWYHCFAVKVAGASDYMFDSSVVLANGVANNAVQAWRRVGSVLTDGSANIVAFSQNGDEFLWDVPVTDLDGAQTTTATNRTLTVPTGVAVHAQITAGGEGGSELFAAIYTPGLTWVAPSVDFAQVARISAANYNPRDLTVRTNTSAQITTDGDSTFTLHIVTRGWIDRRGRDD